MYEGAKASIERTDWSPLEFITSADFPQKQMSRLAGSAVRAADRPRRSSASFDEPDEGTAST